MILEIKIELRKNSKKQYKTYANAKCDHCDKEFALSRCLKLRLKQEFHFCSRKCTVNSHKLGCLSKKRTSTSIAKYGTKSPAQNEIVKQKTRTKIQAKYGEQYTSTSQLPHIKEKIKITNLERYGVECTFQNSEIKEKIAKTNIERYGFANPVQNKIVHEKIKATTLAKHGFEYGIQSPNNKRNSCSARKCHETLKKNGTYKLRTSKIETTCVNALKTIFNNVEQGVMLNHWSIDCFISDINSYLQIDGIYWHGLDRPIEVIKKFKHPRDVVIYNTWIRDCEQVEWCVKNNVNLVRLTDTQIKNWIKQDTLIEELKKIFVVPRN